ncbi:MAG: cytidylate kinase-like family protein, partial [Clostridia bacterium]|nr:cytidylate kinase-like family protein [Clostridia bacterium]
MTRLGRGKGSSMEHRSITIAREFGTFGREIGRKAAELLSYEFYDKELITMAAQKSGLDPEALNRVDEKPTSSLLYSVATGTVFQAPVDVHHMSLGDRLFMIQSRLIGELADGADCVFVGRCADYVLDGRPNVLKIFISADFEERVKAVSSSLGISESEAKSKIVRIDRERANYYSYYSGKKWGKRENYDLVLNVSRLGMEKAAKLIADCARMWSEKD